MKKSIQELLRFSNKSLLKQNLPKKVSIYFHDIDEDELVAIKNIILFFRSHNYNFVTIDEFNHNISNQDKLVALTFDDGFDGWLKLLPMFSEHNAKATFFLNSIFLSDENLTRYIRNININSTDRLISSEGIEELVSCGHEIGAHTHSHFTLSNISYDKFIEEDRLNKEYLQEYFDVKNFAIPYGMRRYLTRKQKQYLLEHYTTISFGEPGMQFTQKPRFIQRHPWLIEKSFFYNIENLCTNTSYFNNLTLRSGLG